MPVNKKTLNKGKKVAKKVKKSKHKGLIFLLFLIVSTTSLMIDASLWKPSTMWSLLLALSISKLDLLVITSFW